MGKRGGQVTAAERRASRAPWSGTILDLMDAAGMTGPDWLPWRAFWKAVYGLPMTPDELAIYQRHTKRDTPPSTPVAESFMLIGRGGGKTRNSALHAVFRGITFDPDSVDPGEDVVIPLLASDRRQANIALKYVRAFNKLPVVAPYVFRGDLTDRSEYRTGAAVEVITASKSAPRGYSCPSGNCDEIAWWKSDDDGANPDHEVLTALRGSLGRVTGSLLLALSNPAAPKGELHAAHEQYFGRDDPDVLVWNADTLSMNPTYDRRTIARAFKKDPVVAASEFGTDGYVVFRQARQALVDEEALRAVIVIGRKELAPVPGVRYWAFIDMAEGSRSGDSASLGIGHRDDERRAVLDLVREVEPPYSPGQVIVDVFAPILERYGIREVIGDRHAAGFVEEYLTACGVTFTPCVHSKSALYIELLHLVNTRAVQLLDEPRLRQQLLGLERRSVRGGTDSVDHPRGGHDDVANVCAGALVSVTGVGVKKKKQVIASFGPGHRIGLDDQPTNAQEQLRRLARRTLSQVEAEDRADRAREKAPAHPVWRVVGS